jgi:hypothetical protein
MAQHARTGTAITLTGTLVLRWVLVGWGLVFIGLAVAVPTVMDQSLAPAAVAGILGLAPLVVAVIVLPRTAWTVEWNDQGLHGKMCWPKPYAVRWDDIAEAQVTAPAGLFSTAMIALRLTNGQRLLIADNMHRQLTPVLREIVSELRSRGVPLDGRGLGAL